MKVSRARYGIDRPSLAALSFSEAALSVALAAAVYGYTPAPFALRAVVLAVGAAAGARFLLRGASYVLGARGGKLRDRDRLFRDIDWQGVRGVLDAGCGPGLLLVGSAKAAPDSRVTGVDIWDRRLESGNSPRRALENAAIEGVGDRVEVREGDIRRLPFTDSTFDLVLSRAVLNHVKGAGARRAAVHELVRVLRPGGQLGLVIVDDWNLDEYKAWLRDEGVEVRALREAARYPPGLVFLRALTGMPTLVGVKGPERQGPVTPGG